MLTTFIRRSLCGSLKTLDLAHPARQWVPTGENLGHQLPHFIRSLADLTALRHAATRLRLGASGHDPGQPRSDATASLVRSLADLFRAQARGDAPSARRQRARSRSGPPISTISGHPKQSADLVLSLATRRTLCNAVEIMVLADNVPSGTYSSRAAMLP
jgi:hypothetical protein